MDAPLARALFALRHGDPLSALSLTQTRTDALSLATRGVALAQLGETKAARKHLWQAERAFVEAGDARQALRARLAEAEVAVLDLELSHARTRLLSLSEELRRGRDPVNAAWALVVAARVAVLQGDKEGAELLLARAHKAARDEVPPHVEAVLALAEGELSARAWQAGTAHEALSRARTFTDRAAHPALAAEIARFEQALASPVARLSSGRTLTLTEVEALNRDATHIVVDACRARIRGPSAVVDLSHRAALFDLFAAIAEAAPAAVPAETLARQVFGARSPNASHDALLRVALGRLRKQMGTTLGPIVQAKRALRWEPALPHVILFPLVPRHEARLRALLADGRAWPASALAEASAQSPRTVQRKLAELIERGEITVLGRGPGRKYALETRAPSIASSMLLADFTSSG